MTTGINGGVPVGEPPPGVEQYVSIGVGMAKGAVEGDIEGMAVVASLLATLTAYHSRIGDVDTNVEAETLGRAASFILWFQLCDQGGWAVFMDWVARLAKAVATGPYGEPAEKQEDLPAPVCRALLTHELLGQVLEQKGYSQWMSDEDRSDLRDRVAELIQSREEAADNDTDQ